jgi:hypothetical protein
LPQNTKKCLLTLLCFLVNYFHFLKYTFRGAATLCLPTFRLLLPQSVIPMYKRVARWFVFKPKIQIWVNFGGSCNVRCWYILRTLGPFYGLMLNFTNICYSSW